MTTANPNLPGKTKGVIGVVSSALLGRWRMWRKPLNDSADKSLSIPLGPVNNMHYNLCEVADYPGAMPVLIDALKKKGVRFDELSFSDGEITYLNQNVVVLRGAAYEVVHRAFHREEHGVTGKKMRQGDLRLINLPIAATNLMIHIMNAGRQALRMLHVFVHKRSLPNEKS
jgi:hypothetical protein